MNDSRQALWRALLSDTLLVGFCLWVALYAAELFKPGFASNYVSLPAGAVALFFMAVVVAASASPVATAGGAEAKAKPDLNLWVILALITLAVLLTLRSLGVSWPLTLIMSLVTLFSLYALSDGS